MAQSDRNEKGKPTDFVAHFVANLEVYPRVTACNKKDPGYATEQASDVSCLRCLKKMRGK